MFKLALVSVSDKSGLSDFLKPLVKAGLRVVSTGGTAKYLRENDIEVIEVSEVTSFPEVMGGRVKTLHPRIHMSLLARLSKPEDQKLLKEQGLEAFDLVVGNLYPFEARPDIETIDIGGPSFLRAAAKNYERITVVCDPSDYAWIKDKKNLSIDDRKKLSAKVFRHTSSYDAMISDWLSPFDMSEPGTEYSIGGNVFKKLRYGENPHQEALWISAKGAQEGLHRAQILQGKELSYNNLLDLESAVSCLRDFNTEPSVVIVKHNNPCGVAQGTNILKVIERAIAADPISAFGGVVAINRSVGKQEADLLTGLFLECIVAPEFTEEALDLFKKKPNLRLLVWRNLMSPTDSFGMRSITGGWLIQTKSQVKLDWPESWKVFGEMPSEEVKNDILFSWKVVAHLKSNAIAISQGKQTLGLGMGQVNRVDAVDQAIGRYKKNHIKQKEVVLSSDAFFPFADSIEKIAESGIRWVVQPGGSIKDEEVLSRAKELGVNVVLTGERHFSH